MIIYLDGNIGAGKSSVLLEMKKRGYITVEEPLEKWREGINLFELSYAYPKKYAFIFQLYILIIFSNLVKSFEEESGIVFFERSFDAQKIFVEKQVEYLNITPSEHDIYVETFEKLRVHQSHHIYLKCDAVTCYERVRMRGREEEQKFTAQYVKEIGDEHDQRFSNLFTVDSSSLQVTTICDIIENYIIGLMA